MFLRVSFQRKRLRLVFLSVQTVYYTDEKLNRPTNVYLMDNRMNDGVENE